MANDFNVTVLAEIGRRDVSRRAYQLMNSQRKTMMLKLIETSSSQTTVGDIKDRVNGMDGINIEQAELEVYRKLEASIYSVSDSE
jgi:hypothetical protein